MPRPWRCCWWSSRPAPKALFAIKDLLQRGAPLSKLRDINVDAITAWKYGGLRIDGVHRTMFYTPQHGLSCALGLLALVPVALSGAVGPPREPIAVSGLLLGLATTLNPFLGAAFSLIYGLAIARRCRCRTRASVAQVLRHAVAAAPPGLAVVWGTLNAMGEGAGDAVTIAWAGHARHAPVVTLLMSLGPVLVPALAGLLPSTSAADAAGDRRRAAACSVGLWLLYFVVLSEASWVGFRAGQILLALITIPLARLLAHVGAWSTHGASRAARPRRWSPASSPSGRRPSSPTPTTHRTSRISARGPGFRGR